MRKQHGLTIIELMITVAVLAIVLVIAAPSFDAQIQNNRSVALGEDFATALVFTRIEAIKRGRAVSICASNAANTACSNDASTWNNGWLVLLDDADNADTSVTPSTILRVWDDLPGNASISVARSTSMTATGTATSFIRFTSTGTLARINNEVRLARIAAFATGCKSNSKQDLTVGVGGMINKTRSDCGS